jgi:hypothetical protein
MKAGKKIAIPERNTRLIVQELRLTYRSAIRADNPLTGRTDDGREYQTSPEATRPLPERRQS